MGAPRLSDQSDRVFILGVETSSTCSELQPEDLNIISASTSEHPRHNNNFGYHVDMYTLPRLIDLLYKAVRVGAAAVTTRLHPCPEIPANDPYCVTSCRALVKRY
jgi:hypothetical protein